MDRLVLTARVEHENARFVAWVDGLGVQVEGESADIAREELVQAMLIWISARDCTDSMAMALSEAGFPEVDEETELHLEFLDSQPGSCDVVYQPPPPKENEGDGVPRGDITLGDIT